MSWPAIPTMSDYAIYVWGSYALTIAAMACEVVFVLRRRKVLQDEQEQ